MPVKPKAPAARKDPKRIEQVGRGRIDDYAWIKDDNWQAVMRDPSLLKSEIRTHLEAENAYTRAMMAGTEALQERLYQEMRGRIKEDDSSVPTPDGPYSYYRRFAIGGQHPIYARTPRDGGGEEILLDVDVLAQGKAYYKVVAAQHSPDHGLLAYAADEQGAEIYTIYVKDIAAGALLEHSIASATGDFSFSPCGQYLLWTHRDDNGRSDKIYRRPARGGADVLVYDEPDDGCFIGVGVSESRQYILINAGNHDQSEWHVIPAAEPTAAPRVFTPRTNGVLYTPTHWNGRWHMLTNADGAVDFKIMACEEGATGREHWRDLIPHQPGRFITQLEATKNYLVRLERADALPRIVLRDQAGVEHAIALEEQAFNLELVGGYEYDTQTQRYIYESPTTPRQYFDYDMEARTQSLRKTQEIPSGHDSAKYETRRIFVAAADGARVPVTVLMRRGQKLDGSAPMLLYGYGSYGISMDADFSIVRLSLLDRGWIYAIAHVRGGAELGFGWFLDGRLEKKPNTFTDFIACAEALIAQGYASAGNIVTEGRSAGGLLMGAIANMRPDLWAGVIGGVPFVDVINTMSDASLPLTPPEWPEWGNPLESAEDYDRIAAYSPYDNIAAKPYPAMLATGGLTDPRVTYWEPTKWAAKLREYTTSTRPILLKMIMTAGHAGSAGRFEHLREIAHDYAFALRAIGAEEAGKFPCHDSSP
jgi:oligopeptidase B